MKKEDFAAMLNGRQYRQEMSTPEIQQAKEAGLVVMFGASDDLMEFRGALNDEVGGGAIFLLDGDLIEYDACGDRCKWFQEAFKRAVKIKALWCKEKPYSWTYETDIPHATFDVMEDGEKYCRGIVFSLGDAKPND